MQHDAEALTIAHGMFHDAPNETPFFLDSARKLFAHLLRLHPGPEQLVQWMKNASEIDKLVRGTEYASMLDPKAAPQRSGVLATMNNKADTIRLLKTEHEATRRWTAREWARQRRGWIFLTSTPETREALKPIISLWLDLLILRLLHEPGKGARRVWFLLDEVGSLQRLPQLVTALTENRKSNNPVVIGIQGKEYLEASSPRSRQIREHMAKQGVDGAGAAQIAAHRTRDSKQALSQEETLRRHREMAQAFGNQPERVVKAAHEREHPIERDLHLRPAQTAVTFARDRNLERDAIVDERAPMRDALRRSMGQATFAEVKAHFEERVRSGDFLEVQAKGPARAFTTGEMIGLERKNIERMKAGQDRYETLAAQEIHFEHLNESQRQAVKTILRSRDQITGLQGAAGTGKITSLAAIREAAERESYQVEGFAPTSRAASQLEEAGIPSTTLQHHLAKSEHGRDGGRHLYFVDESSLTSTKQIHEFFERLKENDRVVLVTMCGSIRPWTPALCRADRGPPAIDTARCRCTLVHDGVQICFRSRSFADLNVRVVARLGLVLNA